MLRYPNLVEERDLESRQCRFNSDSEYQPQRGPQRELHRENDSLVGVSTPWRTLARHSGRRHKGYLAKLGSIPNAHPKHARGPKA